MSTGILKGTSFQLPGQTAFYRGKVRDVYTIGKRLIIVASDRISAFDHILPRAIPYKGQVLNQIAIYFLEATRDICPNWLEASPDPNVTVGITCEPFRLEMVIRGYLVGHAWRSYKDGKRILCGVKMPDGMVKNQAFPSPIITPATKAEEGHDEDISRAEIIRQGIVSEADYLQLEKYTYALFQRGSEMAKKQGLILVDTKYEFGKKDGEIHLIDEIHTPDSSRYFYKEGFEKCLASGKNPKHLSKEFVREWLIEHDFQGLEGQTMPIMSDDFVNLVSDRYIELYEQICGLAFVKEKVDNIELRIEKNMKAYFI